MNAQYEIKLLTSKDVITYKTIRFEALKTNPEAFVGSYEEESTYSNKEFENILNSSDIFGIFDENHIICDYRKSE